MPDVKRPGQSSETNIERFLRGLASSPNPRFVPNATRWDIKRLHGWAQLFDVTKEVIQSPPSLRLVLDGGDGPVLNELKGVLNKVAKHPPQIAYRWIRPACRQVALSGSGDTDGWPGCQKFDEIPAKSPAFHSGMKDVVVFLPPNDLPERNKRLQDYIEGSWIAVVYENGLGQQNKLVDEFLSHIETRARQQKHTPWLFTAGPDGTFKYVEGQRQHGVQPFPEALRPLLS